VTTAYPIAVLVLDDELLIRQAVTDYLQDEGRFTTWGAETTAEAFSILDEGRVQVCLVDVRLKGIDGFTFIEEARPRYPGVAFLVQTGSYEMDVRERARAAGVTDDKILLKPFRFDALVKAIDQAVQG
jgi:CheY-like chemotaxis protein